MKRKVESLDIQRFVTTKIAEFHKWQPHEERESSHLLLLKNTETDKQKAVSHIKLL